MLETTAPTVTTPVRVLVVEDEVLLFALLEDMLEQMGHVAAGVCTDLPAALQAVEGDDFDCVLLDLNLRGEKAGPVAARLSERGIPFVVASGDTDGAADLGAASVIAKPYRFDDIEQAVGLCAGARR